MFERLSGVHMVSAKQTKSGNQAKAGLHRVAAKFEPVAQSNEIVIDEKEPPSRRPLCYRDLLTYFHKVVFTPRNLPIGDAAHALCISSANRFNTLTRKEAYADRPLPRLMEVLVRVYVEDPSPAPWTTHGPDDLFTAVYGSLLDRFGDEGSVHYSAARKMLYDRFAVLLGRTVYRQYSWARGKEASRDVRCLCAKLMVAKDPREVLERIGGQVLSLRGVKLDEAYPLPDPRHPPEPKKKGPKKGVKRAESEAMVRRAAPAKVSKKTR